MNTAEMSLQNSQGVEVWGRGPGGGGVSCFLFLSKSQRSESLFEFGDMEMLSILYLILLILGSKMI